MKTVETIRSLKAAELTQVQAEAIASALESSGIEDVQRDMAVLKWMVGFNLATTIAILWKVFSA